MKTGQLEGVAFVNAPANNKIIRTLSTDFVLNTLTLGVTAGFMTALYLVFNYGFGEQNHIEQLPHVLRRLDPTYLSNDFFVNTTTAYGPRYLYMGIVAGLSQVFPLVHVAFVGTALANFSIALISGLLSQRVFNGSLVAGVVMVVLVMTISVAELEATIPKPRLLPQLTVMPLLLLALWATLRARPLYLSVLIFLACVLHTQISLEVGALCLAVLVGYTLLYDRDRPRDRSYIYRLSGALALYVLAVIVFALPIMLAERIPSEEFIYILAEFRHPHHFIMSTIKPHKLTRFAVGLVGIGVLYLWWVRHPGTELAVRRKVSLLLLALLGLQVLGYIFVELIPMRLWVTAQTLRLTIFINWLGLMMLAGFVAAQLGRWRYKLVGSLVVSLGVLLLGRVLLDHTVSGFGRHTQEIVLILLPIGIALFFGHMLRHQRVSIMVGVLVSGLLLAQTGRQVDMTSFDDETDQHTLAECTRASTPADALLYTPPNWGFFRLLAERALIVDFKAFPFQDVAMREWHQRLVGVYGAPDAAGFPSIEELNSSYYTRTDDDRVFELQAAYDITHAVLPAGASTALPVLCEAGDFVLVSVESPEPTMD